MSDENIHNDENLMPARHKRIIETVSTQGFVSVEALAKQFSVTTQTIRRDIKALNDMGFLQKFHGGVFSASSVKNIAYQTRKNLYPEEKIRIADRLAAFIPDNASLFLNIGTSTEEVARSLKKSKTGLRIITNNLNVASILCDKEDFEVIVAGGVVRSKDMGITGEATIGFIRQFKVDFGIIGVSGIDADGTLLDFDYNEVWVTREIIRNSRKVFLVTDTSKFGRNAMVRLGNLSEIDVVFTDSEPPEAYVNAFSAAETRLVVA
jgi:DeoR family glycerol-3-phosphate regulon repressor